MTMIELLADEFAHEVKATRPLLERLPEDRLAWRPHERSFRAGELGAHLVDCLRWTTPVFRQDALDMDPTAYRPFRADTLEDLVKAFDAEVAASQALLDEADDSFLVEPWELKLQGVPMWRKPRLSVFRDFTLNHLIHHRGQLSVYLRLMGVPVPGVYGPSGDEMG